MEAVLKRGKPKLTMSESDRNKVTQQISQIVATVGRAFGPARDFLEREEFVALVRRQTRPKFRDAETLFDAVRRIGAERLRMHVSGLHHAEFSRPLPDEAFEELRDASYLLIAVPRELGGHGLSLPETCHEN